MLKVWTAGREWVTIHDPETDMSIQANVNELETLIDDLCHAKWLLDQPERPVRELPKLAISALGFDEDEDV